MDVQVSSWWSLSLLTESVHEDGLPSVFEESIYVVKAQTEEDAIDRANRILLDEQVSYVAIEGGRVQWVGRRVLEVYNLLDDEIGDGTEVFSRFLTKAQASAMLAKDDEL